MKIQHGDVILTVAKDIEGLQWRQAPRGYVVERGEGVHTHVTTTECEIAERNGVLYLRGASGIDHEEHGIKILDPHSVYRKGIELEYDAETNEARATRD